jgi:hypothetical protein
MAMLMCLGCGQFVPAVREEEILLPKKDRCPECAGSEFKNVHTDRVVDVGGE